MVIGLFGGGSFLVGWCVLLLFQLFSYMLLLLCLFVDSFVSRCIVGFMGLCVEVMLCFFVFCWGG